MKNTIEVPQDALSIPYEGKEAIPQKGDPVDFRVEGTIRKVNEGWCLVDVKFVNGKRPGPPETEFFNDEEASLGIMAEAADKQEGY